MRDITSKKLLFFKGFLFLVGCLICSAVILIESPTARTAICLFVALWFAARFYYFLFYVIENYIDDRFKFTGVFSSLVYIFFTKKEKHDHHKGHEEYKGKRDGC